MSNDLVIPTTDNLPHGRDDGNVISAGEQDRSSVCRTHRASTGSTRETKGLGFYQCKFR
jgi:hypothetical protein